MTKKNTRKTSIISSAKSSAAKAGWLFEVEPYFCLNGESLQELRDNLRLKKAMKRAIEQDTAPVHLIEAIHRGIRA